jgi:Ca-activated chloride channel family protein
MRAGAVEAGMKRTVATASLLGLLGLALAHAQPPQPIPRPRPIRPPSAPSPRIALAEQDVVAIVTGGVARVTMRLVLQNRSAGAQEGDLILPIPTGAVVRDFSMTIDEKRLDAQLLDVAEATRTYEEIVRQRRDPALLTYSGQAALRARVFPIPAGGERTLRLTVALVLPRERDAMRFSWPLAGPYLPGSAAPERVRVRVELPEGAGTVYSPTHMLDGVRRDPDGRVVATFASDTPAALENPEFTLYIAPKDGERIALSALAYRSGTDPVASLGGGGARSGYFLVVATPTLPVSEKTAPPRTVVLVMDRSGSMQGRKLEQARGALKAALSALRPQDRFNILTFSDRVERLAPETIPATRENVRRAEAFADDIGADGGTNIHGALIDGLAQFPEAGRGNTLLFFTDGLPTVGVRDQKQIVADSRAAAKKKARVFVFGVGYDVDVPFLDTVAQTLRGDADYVRPDEDIEVKTSRFVARTKNPVLENLSLSVSGTGTVTEVYPKPDALPDLFEGGQLVLVGRYTAAGPVRITLRGDVGGKPQVYSLDTGLPASAPDADFLPRLWASRKIGALLDQLRLEEMDPRRRAESEAQIRALSQEFGILTPLTALFVPEPDPGGVPRRPAYGFGGLRGATDRSGESAVNQSQASRAQKAQAIVGNTTALSAQAGADRTLADAQARRLRYVARRTFVQQGTIWQDTRYDAAKQTQRVRVQLYSPAYFALVRRNPDIARWAALGQSVLIAANATQALEFGSDGQETLTDAEVSALASPRR